ncbi:hypothetical protein [Parvularcula oceani]|uniref:hypothetical protein n=1 Tax=Parvularcula oceani TaxID=1247963 RepID=UPI0004E22A64|nr:hypothetical protein [Parvularcula oceani]
MSITQDDLWTLRHLRAAWSADETERRASAEALAQYPGRAEGRVAGWAFSRAASALARNARRPLRIGEGIVPSHDERTLLKVARAVAENDWDAADSAARWLIRRNGVADFTEALAPAACAAYGRSAPRRAKTAHA